MEKALQKFPDVPKEKITLEQGLIIKFLLFPGFNFELF